MIGPGTIPQLSFAIVGIRADPHAAAPTLRLSVAIEVGDGIAVRGATVAVRVRIAAQRRRYEPAEADLLRELFGPPTDFGRSLRPLPWTETTVAVAPFDGLTVVDVALPCTYDFEVVAAKYFAALAGGEVPIEALFSGTLLYDAPDGRLQVARIAWDSEATTLMPVAVWRQAVETAFPGTAWLRLDRRVFARLHEHRARAGYSTWEQTLQALLDGSER